MPTPYPYTAAVPRRAATGRVATIYGQIAADFILTDGPLMSLSPAPDLLAATWALLREAHLAGQAPRVDKEVVATAVSVINHCRFCIDAHAALIHATGEHELAEAIWRGQTPADPNMARLVAWAKATASPGAAALSARPFPEAWAGEYIGTALVTHFINRLSSSLLNEQILPGRIQSSALFRRVAGRTMSRVVRLRPAPGASLALLPDITAEAAPAWATEPAIGTAYAALRQAAAGGGHLLSQSARARVQGMVATWDGAPPPAGAWLDVMLAGLPGGDRPAARLALLAALAPGRVVDADIEDWHAVAAGAADADLIRIIAFGAFAAVERIAGIVAPPIAGTPPGLAVAERAFAAA